MPPSPLLLVLASSLTLLQELVYIRWLPAQVRILAYFPNLILIASFLGLGLGCLLRAYHNLLLFGPLMVLFTVLAGWGASHLVITNADPTAHLWLFYYDLPPDSVIVNGTFVPLISAYILVALSFVPLGQLIARQLYAFAQVGAALRGYCWDIAGSLAGCLLFAVLNSSGSIPTIWFALVSLLHLFLAVSATTARRALSLSITFALIIAALVGVHAADRADLYSPYYALSVRYEHPEHSSFVVLANGSRHQRGQSIAEPTTDQPLDETDSLMRQGYHLPYTYLKKSPKKVLVIGAGNGNDVSVALANGAEEVDAVEIDPKILDVGKRLHPDHPYDSLRVRVFNTDARSFFSHYKEQYDLIVFATLDSMTRLSALSNVRLDDFVYTQESIAGAREHLTSEGGLVLNFAVQATSIVDKLSAMLGQSFPDTTYRIDGDFGMFNTLFLAGPAFSGLKQGAPQGKFDIVHIGPEAIETLAAGALVPSDDWPFLYLDRPTISPFYQITALGIIGTSLLVLLVISAFAKVKVASRPDLGMFFFGVGFLLLETRAVTQMNLVWGATWITSSAVFAAILLMVLLSAIVVQHWGPRTVFGVVGLFCSLALAYLMPVQYFVSGDVIVRFIGSLVFAGLPVFFAGICFSNEFAKRTNADVAFSWNLLGAVAGGLLELLSMVVGLRAMLLIAMASYVAALLACWARAKWHPSTISGQNAPTLL